MTPDTVHNSEILSAKAALYQALKVHDGDPSHEIVAAAIDRLSQCNPTPAPTRAIDRLQANWRLISAPRFPNGEQRSDGRYYYTLGRLAFNMFQPQDLIVAINQVTQPVFPVSEGLRHSHDIVVDFTTASDDISPLRGTVRNLEICEPADDTTLQVQFTGGVLEPAEGTDLHRWQTVFGHSPSSTPKTIKARVQRLVLKLMFGLIPPDGIDPDTGRVEFQMGRSPKGSLTILYLDDDLRITRGQKGTVLVCDRQC